MPKKVTKAEKEHTLAQKAKDAQKSKDDENASALEGTDAGAIWNEIKDKDIEMFALPAQKVHMHAHPVPIEEKKLYLITNSTAVLPSLEAAIGPTYVVDIADRFVTITRSPVSLASKYGTKLNFNH